MHREDHGHSEIDRINERYLKDEYQRCAVCYVCLFCVPAYANTIIKEGRLCCEAAWKHCPSCFLEHYELHCFNRWWTWKRKRKLPDLPM